MQLEEEKKQAKTDEEKKKLLQTAEEIDEIHFLKTKNDKTFI